MQQILINLVTGPLGGVATGKSSPTKLLPDGSWLNMSGRSTTLTTIASEESSLRWLEINKLIECNSIN
jgi:hypothetical protein